MTSGMGGSHFEGRDERVKSVGKKLLSRMKTVLRRGDQTKRSSTIPVPAQIPESTATPSGPIDAPAARYEIL